MGGLSHRTRRNPLTPRERGAEHDRARRWWAQLSPHDRWELGDQFVLGDFDWRDWFDERPTGTFLNEVDRLRMLWEDTR